MLDRVEVIKLNNKPGAYVVVLANGLGHYCPSMGAVVACLYQVMEGKTKLTSDQRSFLIDEAKKKGKVR